MSHTTSSITIGSIVYGSAGIGCKVLEIDGDDLTIETASGKRITPLDRVLKVEPPSLPDRLDSLALLAKSEALAGLTELLGEFSTECIYNASLKMSATFRAIFIRELLEEPSAASIKLS